MGSCFSCSHLVDEISSAKLVCIDGSLREFSIPTKASDVLGYDISSCFICSSNSLCYEEQIQALAPNELVIPGQLYFVLPIKMIRQALSGSDMAALAVKASSALSEVLKSRSRRGMTRIMSFSEDDDAMINEVSAGEKKKWKSDSLRNKKSRSFRIKLSAIEEATE